MPNDRARRLRRAATEEERVLGTDLRKRRLGGLRFRRQHPIGPYIVDFICLERRFIIEVDGIQHAEVSNEVRDAARTRWLETEGYRVFRAWNYEIRENLDGVVESIMGELGLLTLRTPDAHPHPDPPPSRGRGRRRGE